MAVLFPWKTKGKDMAPSIIHVVAACLLDDQNRLLLVRKYNTRLFMMPGGKPEAGEDNLAALKRELYEELGWKCNPAKLSSLGQFSAPAANEEGATVVADVFWGKIHQVVQPQAEIEQLKHVAFDKMDDIPLAPLQQKVMPALLSVYQTA